MEVRPDFQRREVWSLAARIMLIDTILRNVPMPKMFVWNEILSGSTHRRVIDGQQRIKAILDFLSDRFALDQPYEGPYSGLVFSQLPEEVRAGFLQYRIDFNEALGFSEQEVREVYSRINKYSLPLSKQELRQADYPGQFLSLCTELSLIDYFEDIGIFTAANLRRMGDIEFVSELVAGMLKGPQDKKGDLDYFYASYAKWPEAEVEVVRDAFKAIIADLRSIFSTELLPIRQTRFRQKADFYSLFLSIYDLHNSGATVVGKDLGALRRDLQILDRHIAPESNIDLLSEYAIKCVSQANSQASRAWRKNFLMMILSGTYRQRKPQTAALKRLSDLGAQLPETRERPLLADNCVWCNLDLKRKDIGELVLDWPPDAVVYQLSNSGWRGASCGTPCLD